MQLDDAIEPILGLGHRHQFLCLFHLCGPVHSAPLDHLTMQLNDCESYVLAGLEGFLVYWVFGVLARQVSWSELSPDYQK